MVHPHFVPPWLRLQTINVAQPLPPPNHAQPVLNFAQPLPTGPTSPNAAQPAAPSLNFAQLAPLAPGQNAARPLPAPNSGLSAAPAPPAPAIPSPVGLYTYCVVYYLLGDQWVQVDAGWNVDVSTLIYQAPEYVFVWWWTGSSWTSEVVYGGGHTYG
jgi:hypothetical protein